MSPVAVDENQIFNEGGSMPVVTYSLVEGGLSAGSVNSGGIIDGDAGFKDPIGEDTFRGTSDDDLSPTSMSPIVNAGDNTHLPADRFDLDDDGDTSEPLPIDVAGHERIAATGSAGATVDLGAYEYSAMDIARDRRQDAPGASFRLEAPYPNPSGTAATVTFYPGDAARARLTVYDLLGRKVMTAFDGSVTPGSEMTTAIDVSTMTSGLYVIRLTAGSKTVETRLTVAK